MINKKVKKLIMGTVTTMMTLSIIYSSAFAEGNDKKTLDKEQKVFAEIVECPEGFECTGEICDCMMPTYKEFIKDMGVSINKEDNTKLEKLYNEAVDLDEKGKYEESEKVWSELDKIFDKYYEDIKVEMPTYKEFIKDMEVSIKKDDNTKLKKLYNKAVDLDKKEEFEESEKVWNEINEILDKYYENIEFETLDNIELQDS